MKIDVVVPAYNAAHFIEDCLDGLFAAGFAAAEITVVDDGSTDDTAARVTDRGVSVLPMGVNTSASKARNAGTRQGTGEIVLFVDADVVVAPNTRTVLTAFFHAKPDYAAVFGTYDARPRAPGRVSRIRNLLHRHVHLDGAGDAVTFWTGLGAVRRESYNAIGGFDPELMMMEDIDFGLRLATSGGRIWLLPDLQGTHLKAWSLYAMARTDLFHRAIPWTRLLATPAAQALPRTLNISQTGRISVLSVAASLAALAMLPLSPGLALAAAAICLAVLIWANQRFLRSLWTEQSPTDALIAIFVLWTHYFAGGLGYTWVKLFG